MRAWVHAGGHDDLWSLRSLRSRGRVGSCLGGLPTPVLQWEGFPRRDERRPPLALLRSPPSAGCARGAQAGSYFPAFHDEDPYWMATCTSWLLAHLAWPGRRAQMLSCVPSGTRASACPPGPKATVAVPAGGPGSSCQAYPGPLATTSCARLDGPSRRAKTLLRPTSPNDVTPSPSATTKGGDALQAPLRPDHAPTRSVLPPLVAASRQYAPAFVLPSASTPTRSCLRPLGRTGPSSDQPWSDRANTPTTPGRAQLPPMRALVPR